MKFLPVNYSAAVFRAHDLREKARMKMRPQKTAQELTDAVSDLIREHAKPEANMNEVRYMASPLLTYKPGQCNWKIIITTAAADEQRRIVSFAAAIVQRDWDMLERRARPRI